MMFSEEVFRFLDEKTRYKEGLLRNFERLHDELKTSTFSESSEKYRLYCSIRGTLLRYFQVNGISLDDSKVIEKYKDLNLKRIYNV